MRNTITALFVVLLFCMSTVAQDGCPVLPPIHPAQGNIFSPQQERDLGDIIADRQEALSFGVVSDEVLNARLQAVGDRIVKVLPTDMPIRFRLSDLPVVNAFTMPGGRVYVTRKMVAFVKSEDELASILAHESAHVVTHDADLRMSLLFQRVLGVTSVGDRADIFEKYNQLIDNVRRKQLSMPDRVEREQLNADELAMYAMARAGYDPKILAEVWDRFAETQGKTGNWLTDFFGTTQPGAKRLREALKAAESLPSQCIGKADRDADFQKWRAAVVEYTPAKKEQIPGLIAHKQITPPLRADINHLRFSRDGKYLLAQDDSTIFVLKREPLSVLFSIDAPDAYNAAFTPDSGSIVFYNPALRVERWNVEERKRASVNELALAFECAQTALSPDGKYLSCLDGKLGLRIIDVATGAIPFERKGFYQVAYVDNLGLYLAMLTDPRNATVIDMQFSPDARYLVAGRGGSAVAVELATMKPVDLKGKIKELMQSHFTFTGAGNLAGIAGEKGDKSAVVSFPSGAIIDKDILLVANSLTGVTKGDFLIVRPLKNYPAGLADLKKSRVIGAPGNAVDAFGNIFAFEQNSGEVHLRVIGENKSLASVQLPKSSIGSLRAIDVSPDLQVLALSQRSRGGVWNLASGQRLVHVRGFNGASVGQGGRFVADFPNKSEVKRSVVDMDLGTLDAQPIYEADRKVVERVWQAGDYLITLKPTKGDDLSANCNLEFRDVLTHSALWTQPFPFDVPGISVDSALGTAVFGWDARASHLKEQISADPALKSRYDALKDKKGAAVLMVVDAKTGKKLGSVVIDTGKGSFKPDEVKGGAHWLAIADNHNRVLLYSTLTGEEKAVYFGRTSAMSPKEDLLLLENEPGQVTAYSLATLQKVQEYKFPTRVSWMRFSADGKRAFVLTRDQDVYWIDTTSKETKTAAQ